MQFDGIYLKCKFERQFPGFNSYAQIYRDFNLGRDDVPRNALGKHTNSQNATYFSDFEFMP